MRKEKKPFYASKTAIHEWLQSRAKRKKLQIPLLTEILQKEKEEKQNKKSPDS